MVGEPPKSTLYLYEYQVRNISYTYIEWIVKQKKGIVSVRDLLITWVSQVGVWIDSPWKVWLSRHVGAATLW